MFTKKDLYDYLYDNVPLTYPMEWEQQLLDVVDEVYYFIDKIEYTDKDTLACSACGKTWFLFNRHKRAKE